MRLYIQNYDENNQRQFTKTAPVKMRKANNNRQNAHWTPVRIVFVIETLDGGGAERHLVRLLGNLNQSGRWKASVYCFQRTGELVHEVERLGVPVVGPTSRLSKSPWSIAKAVYSLQAYLRRERPQIVQAYLLHAGMLGAVAARLARVPKVVTTRRSVYRYRRMRFVRYRLTVGLMNMTSDAVIAVSHAAKEQAIRHGSEPRKVVVIPNSVSAPLAANRPSEMFDGSPIIGTVGYMLPIKGQRFLIEAAPIVLLRFPRARFVFVGDGPERLTLEHHAVEHGITSRVTFLGVRSDVSSLLSKFDIFALPSLSEGMPNALLEAMAVGVPVIGTRTGGVPELIAHEESGLLVEPGSAEELAAALIRLNREERLRERCVAGAYQVVEKHSPATETSQTEELYSRLLLDRVANEPTQ